MRQVLLRVLLHIHMLQVSSHTYTQQLSAGSVNKASLQPQRKHP